MLLRQQVNILFLTGTQDALRLGKIFFGEGVYNAVCNVGNDGEGIGLGVIKLLRISKILQKDMLLPKGNIRKFCKPYPVKQHFYTFFFSYFICHITMDAAMAAFKDSHRGFMGMIKYSVQASITAWLTP